MTRTLIRTTALTISMAASVMVAGSALATGYLAESPYEQRRRDQATQSLALPTVARPTQAATFQHPKIVTPPAVNAANNVLVAPPAATAPTVSTTPRTMISPVKPLYPGRGLTMEQIAAYEQQRAKAQAAAQAKKPLPLPGTVGAPQSVAPAFTNVVPHPTSYAQTTPTPSRLPLPDGSPAQMPTFKPYATLETQKEIPIDPSVFNVPARSIPAPLPVRDPQLKALGTQPISPMQLPVPEKMPSAAAPVITQPKHAGQPSTALALPALDGLDIPVAPAPKAVAAPFIAPEPEQPTLTSESKRILSKVPKNLDKPETPRKRKVTVNRIDPDVRGILEANTDSTDDVQTHESVGVKIQVRRPKFNADYELEKAYNALMNGHTEIAIDSYKGILKHAPSNQSALFGLATTYHRIGNLDNARPLYGKLISINPHHREALNNFLVLVSEEAPEDALRQLEELEADNPDFSPIPAQMALLLDKMGSPEAARKKLIRAVSLSPNNLAYKYNLAILMDNQHKYSDAAALYRELVKAGNRGETLPADINDLQERLTFIVSNKL